VEHLTRDQLRALLAEAQAHRERDWVLFLVSFWHGLRASEAVSLTPANFTDGFLTVQRLKGSMRTRQPLVEDPDEILNERAGVEAWIAQHSAAHGEAARDRRLFPVSRFQFYRLVRRYGAAAGLPQHLCHPHVFKHSIAVVHRQGGNRKREAIPWTQIDFEHGGVLEGERRSSQPRDRRGRATRQAFERITRLRFRRPSAARRGCWAHIFAFCAAACVVTCFGSPSLTDWQRRCRQLRGLLQTRDLLPYFGAIDR
jgi:hypothetical protein